MYCNYELCTHTKTAGASKKAKAKKGKEAKAVKIVMHVFLLIDRARKSQA